ncbi:hypothetical protein [Lactovum odontotermitis]
MKKNLHTFPVGVLATLIFFVIGYFYSFRFAWLAFLAVPIFRWFADSSQGEEKGQAKSKVQDDDNDEEDDELDF